MQSLWAEQRLKAGASVKHCIVAENVVIGENAVVGAMPTEEEQGVANHQMDVCVGTGAKIGSECHDQ